MVVDAIKLFDIIDTRTTNKGTKKMKKIKSIIVVLSVLIVNIVEAKYYYSPYDDVDWDSALHVQSASHIHITEKQTLDNAYNGGLRHLAISNYHPSIPVTAPIFGSEEKDIVISANSEQKRFFNMRMHVSALGSTFESADGIYLKWKAGFDKILDNLLLDDGGGIVINHPSFSKLPVSALKRMLDYDNRVLGIEVWNNTAESINGSGWSLKKWDALLRTGRRCLGFFVSDHAQYKTSEFLGRNILLVDKQLEVDLLQAYRNGTFYGALKGSGLRFENISIKDDMLNIQTNKAQEIIFITESGIVKKAQGNHAAFKLPQTKDRYNLTYIRVEASDDKGERIFSQPIHFTKQLIPDSELTTTIERLTFGISIYNPNIQAIFALLILIIVFFMTRIYRK